MAAARHTEEYMPLPPSDEQQRPGEIEPDTVIAVRQIEGVHAMFAAEARPLYRDVRLKDLPGQRRELPGDARGTRFKSQVPRA